MYLVKFFFPFSFILLLLPLGEIKMNIQEMWRWCTLAAKKTIRLTSQLQLY